MTRGEGHEVPEAWRVDAERVRRHLVALRGGAPFLSPDDAERLLGWLEAGRQVASVLAGLEAAAELRRRKRARAPLALRHVKLTGAAGAPWLVCAADASGAMVALRQRLGALQGGEALVAVGAAALGALRSAASPDDAVDIASRFWEDGWAALGEHGRTAWREEAAMALAAVVDALDEGTREAVLEEHARATWRASMPELSVNAWVEACRCQE
ncbi:MAG: hypothetical protein RLZZ383_1574 [Pseudomonadota bacterium]